MRWRWIAMLAGAGVAVASAAFFAYRAEKVAALDPSRLERPMEYAGDSDAPCRLLLVGDSRIAYWPLVVPRGWRMGRLGFPGEASVNIAPPAIRALPQFRPDVVVIQMGGNDAAAAALSPASTHPDIVAAAVGAIEDVALHAKDTGTRKVIVLSLVPPIAPGQIRRAVYGDRMAGVMHDISRSLEKRAGAGSFEMLDAESLFRHPNGQFRGDLRADAVHWNEKGYRLLDRELWRMIGQDVCHQRGSR